VCLCQHVLCGELVLTLCVLACIDIRAQFAKEKHELNVSTYQMCILMLFNETDSMSYKDILRGTEIPPADLKRSLQSLACVKVGWFSIHRSVCTAEDG
jgi:hypothetical protein